MAHPVPWWVVGRWQAFLSFLLVACSFIVLWAGVTYNYTQTNYTVHEPGETVTLDGVTFKFVGMVRTQVGTGKDGGYRAAPGMTYVALVLEITTDADLETSPYCPIGLTNLDQSMVWSSEQGHVIGAEFQASCFDAPLGETSNVVLVFEVPSSQAERIGGVVVNPATWRRVAEVIR